MFEIILKGDEYKYTGVEFKKLMNLVNFHGEDIVSALRKISMSTSSSRLKELLNGFAVAINTGGNLHQFLNKHSENLLFDYKLEREKYTKISETFMDIYISVAIAAPMILLMIFVIIGGTGLSGGIFNLSTNLLSLLLITIIIFINVFFIAFLRLKQPTM
jgi:archaellum biogenesis protein FlaJ (TadC family)